MSNSTNPCIKAITAPWPTRVESHSDCCVMPRAELARLRANQARRLVILVNGIKKGGISYAISKLLALLGHIVIVAEREQEAGREAVRDIRKVTRNIWFVHLDLLDNERVQQLLRVIDRKWGRLDAVINTAGPAVLEVEALYDREVVVNLAKAVSAHAA